MLLRLHDLISDLSAAPVRFIFHVPVIYLFLKLAQITSIQENRSFPDEYNVLCELWASPVFVVLFPEQLVVKRTVCQLEIPILLPVLKFTVCSPACLIYTWHMY